MTPLEVRLELLAALDDLSRLFPDWRLGQMMANIAYHAGRDDPGGVWEVEDEAALTATRELISDAIASGRCVNASSASTSCSPASAAARRAGSPGS